MAEPIGTGRDEEHTAAPAADVTHRRADRGSTPASPAPAAAHGAVKRILEWPVELGRDWLVRFVELQGVDRGVALGAQAFTALFPLLIVYSAVVSARSGHDFADRIIQAFSLHGAAAQSVNQAFAAPSSVESQINAVGAILLVGSALSFTGALQRLYQLSWQQPSLGVRAAPWGLAWVGLAVVLVTVRPSLVTGLHGVTRLVISLLFATVLWFVTPYVLLGRRVPWRRLLPGAALTALGMTALSVSSAVWMPRSVATAALHYGVIGVAFALLGWLVAAGLVLVVASAGGSVIDERLRGADGHHAESTTGPVR